MICKENDMKKRTLALALASLMLLSSCSSGTGDETKAPSSETKGTEKTEESAETEAETEEDTSYKDDLGDSTFCGELRDGAMRQLFDSKKNTLASRAKSLEKIMKIKLSELPGVGDAE